MIECRLEREWRRRRGIERQRRRGIEREWRRRRGIERQRRRRRSGPRRVVALAPDDRTIYPVDLAYSNLVNLVTAVGGGYWLTVSNIRAGQPAGSNGLADVRLLRFTEGAAEQDIVIASDPGLNNRWRPTGSPA
ncbi:hypothetical protein WMF18_14755 [Sorangium sp. So ce315]|uniref:hypothetical protein n=1 Tax=Sorangium sp. So ce315 TaxID=3133299 RepID=UPI003F5E04B3